jgi:hypothetical protein
VTCSATTHNESTVTFLPQRWLHKHATVLHHMHTTCLVKLFSHLSSIFQMTLHIFLHQITSAFLAFLQESCMSSSKSPQFHCLTTPVELCINNEVPHNTLFLISLCSKTVCVLSSGFVRHQYLKEKTVTLCRIMLAQSQKVLLPFSVS